MVRIFKIDAKIWNAFLICVRGAASPRSSENWKASFENRKVSSEDVEGFFQRVLALYVNASGVSWNIRGSYAANERILATCTE